VQWFTGAGQMGESLLAAIGILPVAVFGPSFPPTTAETTRGIAQEFLRSAVDLIVFAGGDGTARDIVGVVGTDIPVLGIPAGVKMRSGCFSVTPVASGAILSKFIDGTVRRFREVEIVDAAEPAGAGDEATRLFGHCRSPDADADFMQNPKARRDDDEADREAITWEAWKQLSERGLVVCGPGRTAKGVFGRFGVSGTLLGVDIVDRVRGVVELDVDERRLFETVDGARRSGVSTALVVGVLGGQGSLLGRGNQQLSSRVVEAIGFENVLVVASLAKIGRLSGLPLLIDWEDAMKDDWIPRYVRVIAGAGYEVVYPVRSG